MPGVHRELNKCELLGHPLLCQFTCVETDLSGAAAFGKGN